MTLRYVHAFGEMGCTRASPRSYPGLVTVKYHRAEKTTMAWPRQKDARGENTKFNYGLDTAGEKEKRTSKKNVDRRSTSSQDNKKYSMRSMEKQRGMAFVFRKTATAV